MRIKGLKVLTSLLSLFVFVTIFFSLSNKTEAGCSDYCCGGQDGLGAPTAGPGQTDNKDEVCKGKPTYNRYAGKCGEANCVEIPSEKGYCLPWPEQTWQYCCGPYYQICVNDCQQCIPSCPVPLVSTEPSTPPHDLSEYFYDDIASCTDTGCSNPPTRNADCYEVPSPQPTAGLVIHPEGVSTYLSFTSDNHTGGGLYATDRDDTVNDFFPYSNERYSNLENLFYMDATFTDSDNPIESTYIWFNKSGIKPITPKKIDLNNNENPNKYGTNSQEAFGFLLHHSSGVWTPYIPAISGVGSSQTDLWKKASNGYLETVEGKIIISIPGPTGIIAKVLIYSVEPSNNGKTIKVRFSISFKEDEDTLLVNRPIEGNYKIWLMGNDTFGFTPYDNYEDKEAIVKNAVHNKWVTNERIRYYDQWVNSNQQWNLNFNNPNVTLTLSPESGSNINIGWTFNGNISDEFSALVINLYKSDGLVIDPVMLKIGPTNYPSFSPEYLAPGDIESRKIGSLNINHEKYLLKLEGGSGNGSGILGLNNVGQGELYFYLTAFDKGGNIGATGRIALDLRDWLITQGGLLYSNSIDINVNHGGLPTGWDTKNLLENILHQYADVSTELVGLRGSESPVGPSKSGDTKSYMIRPYSTPDPTNGYYGSLKERFNRKRTTLTIKEMVTTPSISGSLSSTYGVNESQVAVLDRRGDLNVTNGFICDRQGVFFVSGILTIDGRIANGNINKDACIFVVGGTVSIGQGDSINGSQLEYDEVNAYILADGMISIEKDDVDYNGLYISGGIHSLSNPGVVFGRSLKVADRLRFPALVINHHSKYGILGRRLFGDEVKVQEVEVGITPY